MGKKLTRHESELVNRSSAESGEPMHKKNSLLKFFFPFWGKKMYIICRALQQIQMLRILLKKVSRNWERHPVKSYLYGQIKTNGVSPSIRSSKQQFWRFYA
jgi:hypothetical protein